ncbi:MAG: hypothetical protein GY789_26945 [Hyphomicrobiales bacterium]|nr:hypothetical protein [Hyphomicrobiales bacterium]
MINGIWYNYSADDVADQLGVAAIAQRSLVIPQCGDCNVNVVIYCANNLTITSTTQLDGKKVRANSTPSRILQDLGMTIVALPDREVLPAMQVGLVDCIAFQELQTMTVQAGSSSAAPGGDGTTWNVDSELNSVKVQKLLASDGTPDDWFGHSVSMSDDTLLIGAMVDDDNGDASGSAYVFTRDATGIWTQQAKLTASDGAADDKFGISVSVSADTALIGTWSGSAYVFTRDATGIWTQRAMPESW